MKAELNPFRDLLRQRVKEKKLSGEKLARMAGLDGGYTRAILRGDRRISEFSDDLPKLAEALDIPLQQLKAALLETRKIEEKEKQKKKKQRRVRTKLSSSKETLQKVLRRSLPEGEQEVSGVGEQSDSVPDENKQIMQSLIDILKNKAKDILEKKAKGEKHDCKVLLTYQGSASVSKDEKEWVDTVKNLLELGVDVTHFIRLDSDTNRTLNIVQYILQYVGFEGKYEPYTFNEIGVLQVPYGMLIICEGEAFLEAFLGFATNQAEFVDAGVHLECPKDQKLINILANHFKQLKKNSTALIKEYSDAQREHLIKVLSELDKAVGESIIIANILSDIAKPDSLFGMESSEAEWLRKVYSLSDKELKKAIEIRKQRKRELIERLDKKRCSYVYRKLCIEKLVEEGLFDPRLKDYPRLTDYEIIQVLYSLIELLENPNYWMALLSEDEWIRIELPYCEVRDGVIAVMGISLETSENKDELRWIEIRDTFVTSTLHAHFSRFWEKEIPMTARDKFLLLQWFKEQIRKVESRMEGKA